MVELEQLRLELQAYEGPLQEVRDSLCPAGKRETSRRTGPKDGRAGFLGRDGRLPESDERA